MSEIDRYRLFARELLFHQVNRFNKQYATADEAAQFLRSAFAGILFALLNIEQNIALEALGII